MSVSRLFRWLSFPAGEDCASDPRQFFCCPPVLDTGDLTLRPMQMADAKDIYAYASDREVARYVLWDAHRSISVTRSYIRYVRSLYRRGLPSAWAIERKTDRRVIGTIGFVGYSRENGCAELGYSMARDCWNQGFATRALDAVIHASFDHLPSLNRIEAQHDVRNPASGRVMEKCGMHREGILRSRIRYKGEFADLVLYSILRAELRKS